MADPEMPRGPRRRPVVIDFHAHIANEEVNAATYGVSVLGRLRAAGVATCEWVGRDTCAEPELFFSNRRAFKQGEPDYGRLLSAIVLTR
jgi:copper oxidase (laccase) domain-containing protein